MNINECGCRPYGWPRPWWWSVYPRDTPTTWRPTVDRQHWDNSLELRYRNRAQTGQLNPLFHNSVDLMNRVEVWQNTDWLESNSFFTPTDRQTRLKALSSRTMLSQVTILTTAVPSVSYNDPFYVVLLFQIHEPPVYTAGWGSAMRTVRICTDPCVKVTIICSGRNSLKCLCTYSLDNLFIWIHSQYYPNI